jgi:hypothetical protein
MTLVCLSGCHWFGFRRAQTPDPTEIIVTGAPKGSLVFIDDVQSGEPTASNNHPQMLNVTAGSHTVEIRMAAVVVYREDTYVAAGEHRVINVLSGFSR